MKQIREKLTNHKGETIAEVLVACLIAAMGLLMLATMITASQHLIDRSEARYRESLLNRNKIEEGAASEQAEIKITKGTLDDKPCEDITVQVDLITVAGTDASGNPVEWVYQYK